MACWQELGCDEEMHARCPHAQRSADHMCVLECFYAACDRPQHAATSDPALIFDTTVDRSQTHKQTCLVCEFFLTHAPRLG
ncbi:MAG: hypothetical protein LBL67_06490 [Coriobacteriales bacterium]|jgi:hypothetical protein|nr:hypothetical protein [Coriobacteriales bacterium]